MDQNIQIHSGEEGVVESEGLQAVSILGVIAASAALIMLTAAGVVEIAVRAFDNAKLDATEMTGYPLKRETRTAGEALLNRYEGADPQTGRYHIPIERAMELEVRDRTANGN